MSAPFFLGEMDQEVPSTKIDYTQLMFFQKSKSFYFIKNLDLVLFLFVFILENKKLTILKNIKKIDTHGLTPVALPQNPKVSYTCPVSTYS